MPHYVDVSDSQFEPGSLGGATRALSSSRELGAISRFEPREASHVTNTADIWADGTAHAGIPTRASREHGDALLESEQRFRDVTDLSSDWYWEQDALFRFTFFSGRFMEKTGIGPNFHLGKRRWEVPSHNLSEQDWAEHKAVLERHEPFHDFVVCRLGVDGQLYWSSVSGRPVFDRHGIFKGYRGIGRDISESHRREEALLRFRVAIDSTADGIHIVDCETLAFIDVNQSACRFLGYTRTEFLALSIDDIAPGTDMAKLAQRYIELFTSEDIEQTAEIVHQHRNGRRIPIEIRRKGVVIGGRRFAVNVVRDITQRKADESALRESEARFRSLTELSSDWYWEQDENLRFTSLAGGGSDQDALRPASHDFGKLRWELPLIDGSDPCWQSHREVLAARLPFRDFIYSRGVLPEGGVRYASISGHPVFDEAGVFRGYRGIGKDITARMRAEHSISHYAMQQSLIAEFGQQALQSTNLEALTETAIGVVDRGLGVVHCQVLWLSDDSNSLHLKAGSGWEPGWVGRTFPVSGDANAQTSYVLAASDPVVVDDFATETRFVPSAIVTCHGLRSGADVQLRGVNGLCGMLGVYAREQRQFTSENISFLQSIANTLATAVDRKEAEQRLTFLAHFDTLTGMPNRSLFLDRFTQSLTQAARNDWLTGVMFIDLDRFKVVNDTLGHSVGDELLIQVSHRLQQCLRSGDTVGRLGGDEFAVVLANLAKPDDAGLVAQKVVAALSHPFHLGTQEVYVSASLGIAISPQDGIDATALLKNADTAMYRAKERGRNNYQFYLPEMNARAVERLQMETQLRGALDRGEFLLHYQPKAHLSSGELSGFEALLRWQHPERGLVQPLDFISILEDTGLIIPVGEWVVRSVCQQIQRWIADGVTPRPVAINLSARQFQHRDLDAIIRSILAETGIDPGWLEFELTESMLMGDSEASVRALNNMKSFGVRLSVDDFGAGYSCLAYLKRFPLDALKIDRAFIRDVTTDPDDASIALAIISLAHSLKLKVVAEGVETNEQLQFLRLHNCDEVQGYYFSKPLAVSDCTRALVEGWRL